MGNIIIISFISCIAVAAIGARIANAEPWKGSLLAVAYVATILIAGLVTPSAFLGVLAALIVISILSGPMGLKRQQITNIGLGCVIGQFLPFFILGGGSI